MALSGLQTPTSYSTIQSEALSLQALCFAVEPITQSPMFQEQLRHQKGSTSWRHISVLRMQAMQHEDTLGQIGISHLRHLTSTIRCSSLHLASHSPGSSLVSGSPARYHLSQASMDVSKLPTTPCTSQSHAMPAVDQSARSCHKVPVQQPGM